MRVIGTILAAALLAFSGGAAMAASKRPHKHYAYQGGHYANSKGSSHKGGHYKNPRTQDHYTHHRK